MSVGSCVAVTGGGGGGSPGFPCSPGSSRVTYGRIRSGSKSSAAATSAW
ncbi:hypothetical protein [Streptomyces sp. NPDC054975]